MSISIHLHDEQTGFAPGGTIAGEVRWNQLPVSDKTVISLELAFRTEGKGTSQREVFHELEWPVTMAKGNESFTIEAPNWPWSFSGKLVSILWALDAWQGNEHAEAVPVTISPNGDEMDLYSYDIDEIELGRWEKMFSSNRDFHELKSTIKSHESFTKNP